MRDRLQARIKAAGRESGLTIIEVLVAAVILVMGAAATFGVLGAATKNAQRAKATQVALDLAQEEMERLHSLPYESLALNSEPKTASGSLKPGSRVSGSQFALMRNPVEDYAPLVIDHDEGISPESEFFTGDPEEGGIRGTLYRYVVWRDDAECTGAECPEEDPGSEDYKQVVVAVKPDRAVSQGGEAGYVEVQSKVIDPEAAEDLPDDGGDGGDGGDDPDDPGDPGGGGPGGGGSGITAQQFFFSDTPCAASGTTTRVDIAGDHLLHNTLGTCASGLQTGTTLGAPDALLLDSPPDPDPEDENNPSLFDYADDFYLEPTPDTDKGVQIRRDDTSGCHYDPTGATNPESQVHRWVTDPMPLEFEVGEKVTLELYTRTLNDALYTGTLCVYLFKRVEAGSPPEATDTWLVDKDSGNTYWTYEPEGNGYWPRNMWTRVRLTMEIEGASSIPVDGRLGVALSVDRANTPADAIPVMYDHPNYPTRIEVESSTPIEGG